MNARRVSDPWPVDDVAHVDPDEVAALYRAGGRPGFWQVRDAAGRYLTADGRWSTWTEAASFDDRELAVEACEQSGGLLEPCGWSR